MPVSTKELLNIALREAMIQKLTLKVGAKPMDSVPRASAQQQKKKPPDKIDINDLPRATYFIANSSQLELPTEAVVHQDCVATYLENISPGEKLGMVYMAREIQVLHSLHPIVNEKGRVEIILDSEV